MASDVTSGDSFFWVLVAVFLAGNLLFYFLYRRHKNKRWLTMGDTLGFAPVPEKLTKRQPLPTLHGRYGGRGVSLYHVVEGGGKNKKVWTAVEFSTNRTRPDYELKLTHEGVADWFQKRFGGQDIEVGDEAFDKRFRIQSNEVETTQRLLADPGVREALLERKRFGALTVRSARVTYLAKGFQVEAAHFEGVFPVVMRVTSAVETAVPASGPRQPPVP